VRLLSGSLAPGCRPNEFGQLFERRLIAYEKSRHAGKAATRGADGFETFARLQRPSAGAREAQAPWGCSSPVHAGT
jgi:hypothetical protein